MKVIIALLIAFVPGNKVRIFLYRIFLGYGINYSSRIGFLNLILSQDVKITDGSIGFLNLIISDKLIMDSGSRIHKLNRIKHLHVLHIGSDSEIRSKNFIGAPPKSSIFPGKTHDQQNLIVGSKSSILRTNYFDVVAQINIGDNVVFGGNGSEIWTHGFDVYRNMLSGPISIGNNIFIGSNCVFTKGIHIVDEVTISPMSVIYKSIEEKGVYSTHKINKIK